MKTLKAVTSLAGNTAELATGTVTPAGYDVDFEFEDLPGIIRAFRRMVRGLAFDICEMALTTYLCAREHGVKFIALPIFPVRAFHHGAILHHVNRPIGDLRELEGCRVGVGRGYTVTTGVWARSILQEEHGVDLSKVTWVLSGDEHVQSYAPPANVEPLAVGQTLEAQLLSGELIAAINMPTTARAIQPLIPNALDSGVAAFKSRGHYPINHCIVLREDVLEASPGLGVAVFNAFVESKCRYLERLAEDRLTELDGSDQLYRRVQAIDVDPLPYGIAQNRAMLEQLLAHAITQKIVKKPVEIETLFAPETHDLIG